MGSIEEVEYQLYLAIDGDDQELMEDCLDRWESAVSGQHLGSGRCRAMELIILISQRFLRAGVPFEDLLYLKDTFFDKLAGTPEEASSPREILREYAEEAAKRCGRDKAEERRALASRAARFIEDNCAKPITMSDVAEQIFMSEATVRGLLRRELGTGFKEIQNRSRIHRARELLRTTRRNVSDLAETLGFTDASHFCKTFRKEVGITPTEFRSHAVQLEVAEEER